MGGRTIYNDYVKCCHGRIGLQTMTEAVRQSYMERIWMKALTKNIQKKALVQKRSAIYTVMQNIFTGKFHNQGIVFQKRCFSSTVILGSTQICVVFE